MSANKLDLTKPLQFRDPSSHASLPLLKFEFLRAVKLAHDVEPRLLFVFTRPDGTQYVDYRWSNGQTHANHESPNDIINTPPPKCVRYLNVYHDGSKIVWTSSHESRTLADRGAANNRVACVRVEIEEGRFDD